MDASDRYRLLYELGAAFAAQLELEELIPAIVSRCREVWGAEGAAVLLLDPSENQLYFPYVADEDEAVSERLRRLRFPATLGVAGAVLASGRSEAVTDAAGDPRFYGGVDEVTGIQTRTMLAARLATRRGSIGVIEIINPRARSGSLQADIELLDALAAMVAIAVDNARMFSELRAREERLRSQVGALRRDAARRDGFAGMIGSSVAIAEVFRLMESAATSSISVLIQGETGTGKELVARGIHGASERAASPFVAINCAALPADLLEAELFGHARGAFTGAIADRRGLFEAADGGTIFLDEIGDLAPSMQVKLLRVLQEGEILPVGTTKPRKIDVRVISATHRDIRDAVDSGSFRADLYYRISAFPILVPALRERQEDIPLLAERFTESSAARHEKHIRGIAPEAFATLAAYAWPGNVRQLQNEIERAVVLSPDDSEVTPSVLSAEVRGHATSARPGDSGRNPTNADLRDARAAFEARFIAEQLRLHDGNVSRTAAAMGISRVMLQKKMKDYGLREP
jgi:transcriptional regulator with GAF, ATPase, and Fis domain